MRTYPEIGVPDPHHPLTHHRGNTEWIERVTKVNTMHMELFSNFIEKMKATPDGDGTLLDHSMIVYGSGLSDGNRHTHEDLPILIVGRGGNFVRSQHIVYEKGTPMTNLFLTLLDRMGVPAEQIGDSGEVAILSASANATNQNAWIELMKTELSTNHPNITLVDTVYGNDKDQESFDKTAARCVPGMELLA